MKRAMTLVLAWKISLLLAAAPAVGQSRVLVVDDDGTDCPNREHASIQAAVDAAMPGATILVCAGTYFERVEIMKNGLTLRAIGAPEEVVIDADLLGHGIRIANATGVTVEGFTVRDGNDVDILLLDASDNVIRRNVTTAAAHDGIELVRSHRNRIEHNVAVDNPADNACGINIIAGSQDNLVRNNVLRNNEWGIQIAGATTTGNDIFHNWALDNRGNGIRNVGGASGTVIDGNRVFRNGLEPGPLTGATNAGIRIAAGTGIVVVRNHVFDNQSVDIRSDVPPGAATFENNHCVTSSPPGLCEHTNGKGKSGQ